MTGLIEGNCNCKSLTCEKLHIQDNLDSENYGFRYELLQFTPFGLLKIGVPKKTLKRRICNNCKSYIQISTIPKGRQSDEGYYAFERCECIKY